MGLWKLYTSHLSTGAKVGISLAIFIPPTIVSGFVSSYAAGAADAAIDATEVEAVSAVYI